MSDAATSGGVFVQIVRIEPLSEKQRIFTDHSEDAVKASAQGIATHVIYFDGDSKIMQVRPFVEPMLLEIGQSVDVQ